MSQTDKNQNQSNKDLSTKDPSIKDPSTNPSNPNPKPGMKDDDQKTATDKPPVTPVDSKHTADKSSTGMSGDSKR